jgi:hypothetical protein
VAHSLILFGSVSGIKTACCYVVKAWIVEHESAGLAFDEVNAKRPPIPNPGGQERRHQCSFYPANRSFAYNAVRNFDHLVSLFSPQTSCNRTVREYHRMISARARRSDAMGWCGSWSRRHRDAAASSAGVWCGNRPIRKVELSCSIRPQPSGLRDALRVLDRYVAGLNETMFYYVADTIGTVFDRKHVPPYPSSRTSC